MCKTLLPYGVILALALLGAGCETGGVSSRIQEKAAVFGTLSAEQQQTIKGGGVERGFSPDMVYMAVGKPSKTEMIDTPQGKVEKWTFNKYFGPRPNSGGPTVTRTDARYSPQTTSPNAPTHGGQTSPSLSATSGGIQPGLDIPDMQASVLMVYFLEGAVYDMKIKEPGQ